MPNPSPYSSDRRRPRARIALGASALAAASATSAFGFFLATEGYYGNEATTSSSTAPDRGSDASTTTNSSDARAPVDGLYHEADPLSFLAMSVLEAVAGAQNQVEALAAGDADAAKQQPAKCEPGRCIVELLPAAVLESIPEPPQIDLEQQAPVATEPALGPVVDGQAEVTLGDRGGVADAGVPGAIDDDRTEPPLLLMPLAAVEDDDLGPVETTIALPSSL